MTQTAEIRVNVAPRGYAVHVGIDLLRHAGAILRRLSAAARCAVVTDTTVGEIHLPALQASLRAAGFEATVARVAPGEAHKTLEDAGRIYDALLASRIERSTPLIALGGGIVGDLGGFVAATILRGVPFVQAPTTLLAMVDASVGGKTGVNHAQGKNLIGAFCQPMAVVSDVATLATLPEAELREGLAECVKHEIIRDAAGFEALEGNLPRALARETAYLTALVAHNVTIKARVVEADPLEQGERAHLNLGHTFAHAIERVSAHAARHGQAVAVGLRAAAATAARLGLLGEAEAGRIGRLLDAAGLSARLRGLRAGDLLEAMRSDKKVQAGRVRLVLPRGLGAAVVRDDVPESLILEALRDLGAE